MSINFFSKKNDQEKSTDKLYEFKYNKFNYYDFNI